MKYAKWLWPIILSALVLFSGCKPKTTATLAEPEPVITQTEEPYVEEVTPIDTSDDVSFNEAAN